MMKISFLTAPSGSGKTFLLDKLSDKICKLDTDEIGQRYSDVWMVSPIKLSQWLTDNALQRAHTHDESEIVIAGICDNIYEVIRIILEFCRANGIEFDLYYLWNRDVSDFDDFAIRLSWLSRIYPHWQVIYDRFSKNFKFSRYDSMRSLIRDGISKILDDRFGMNSYVKADQEEE